MKLRTAAACPTRAARSRRSLLAALLVLVTASLALTPSGASAVILPGSVPWDVRVRASGSVNVAWKIDSGIKGYCTDWYHEAGSQSLVVKRPAKAGKGLLYNGLLSAFGKSSGGAVVQTLATNGGSALEDGCPAVCPKAFAAPLAPTARAADCTSAQPYRPTDVSGCDPSIRRLRATSFTVRAGSPGRRTPSSVIVTLPSALAKPFVGCPGPPVPPGGFVLARTVPMRLLPKLKKGGMVSGVSTGRSRPCTSEYPKDDGYTKVQCTVSWELKVTILRVG